MGILMALLLRGTMFRGEAVPFVMELPNYRMPGAKNVGQLLWEKAKDFLQRAFTVIFLATIVIWFLQTFDTQPEPRDGLAGQHPRGASPAVIAPVFAPLGFGDWRISTALITGFMAKESVVSTLIRAVWLHGGAAWRHHPGSRGEPARILSAVHTVCRSDRLDPS